MALLIYRQTLTLSTKRWNVPCRKDGDKWVPVKCETLRDRYDRSLRGAIIKIKDKVAKIGIWECSMTSTESGGYRIYTLVCKRIKS